MTIIDIPGRSLGAGDYRRTISLEEKPTKTNEIMFNRINIAD